MGKFTALRANPSQKFCERRTAPGIVRFVVSLRMEVFYPLSTLKEVSRQAVLL